MHRINAAYCYRCRPGVCLCVGHVFALCKTTKPIVSRFVRVDIWAHEIRWACRSSVGRHTFVAMRSLATITVVASFQTVQSSRYCSLTQWFSHLTGSELLHHTAAACRIHLLQRHLRRHLGRSVACQHVPYMYYIRVINLCESVRAEYDVTAQKLCYSNYWQVASHAYEPIAIQTDFYVVTTVTLEKTHKNASAGEPL